MSANHIQEPWLSFLRQVDSQLEGEVVLHCLGGFAITVMYGSTRITHDVDFVSVKPHSDGQLLVELAGKETALHTKYGTYLDFVSVVTLPEDYDLRLSPMPDGGFKHLRLYALDPYDIVLAKLERNLPRDREDVKYLAEAIPLDLDILKDRYMRELRPYLATEKREDLTLKLWIEMIEEDRVKTKQQDEPSIPPNQGFVR
jgi:hypothetical protein